MMKIKTSMCRVVLLSRNKLLMLEGLGQRLPFFEKIGRAHV